MKHPDILLFMSDQHAAYYTGAENTNISTPCLNAIAAEGTRFTAHYTSCPLCVPARMSFLSSALPTKISVTDNTQTLAECRPTFLFPLVEAGYETVLIGRMHFIGKDLRHGFTKRIGEDMTPTSWLAPREAVMRERGREMLPTFSSNGSLNIVGGGESPVVHYDKAVVEQAVAYLSEPHEKPQFIVVGTFGPHSPYIANPDLYLKYKAKSVLPHQFDAEPDFVIRNPWLKSHRKEVTQERAMQALAAYSALIEMTDRNIDTVYNAFQKYACLSGRPAIFGYTSDHGDMIGARRMYGKQTFFEDSVRVPLYFVGDGIPKGCTVSTPTSIMDLGPTFCEWAGTQYSGSYTDGISVASLLTDSPDPALNMRSVFSENIDTIGGFTAGGWEESKSKKNVEPERLSYARMVRQGKYKFITYHGNEENDCLFDLEADPEETINVIDCHKGVAASLRKEVETLADPTVAEAGHCDRKRMLRWLRSYESVVGCDDRERWKDNPPTARGDIQTQ